MLIALAKNSAIAGAFSVTELFGTLQAPQRAGLQHHLDLRLDRRRLPDHHSCRISALFNVLEKRWGSPDDRAGDPVDLSPPPSTTCPARGPGAATWLYGVARRCSPSPACSAGRLPALRHRPVHRREVGARSSTRASRSCCSDGLRHTLKAFALAAVLSLVLGALLAAGRLSDHRPVALVRHAVRGVLPGHAVLIMIFFIFVGLLRPATPSGPWSPD